MGYKPTHAFQACALNHSAISPANGITVTKLFKVSNIFPARKYQCHGQRTMQFGPGCHQHASDWTVAITFSINTLDKAVCPMAALRQPRFDAVRILR